MRRLLELDYRRALVIVAITIAATLISWLLFPINHGADFAQFHFAARNWLSGANAYDGGYPIMRATRVIPEPFFYPFPTLFAIAPFALMPLRVGMAAFVA